MNHGTELCNNDDCPSKESCKRYQAYLMAKMLKLVYMQYITPTIKDGKCEMYYKY